MKRTITLLTTLTILAFTGMEALASRLVLITPTNQASMTIQGQRYFSNHGRFVVNDLRPGNHGVAIRARGGHDPYRQPRNYHRHEFHPGTPQVYRGRIRIAPHSVVYARLTRNGRLVVDRVEPLRPPRHINQRQPQYDRRPSQRRYDNRYDNRYDRRGNNFNQMLSQMNRLSFDSERVSLAKQYTRTNRISSNEVLRIMRTFHFESSRVQYAKFAYHHVYDPKNYFVVNKGFDFSSSIRQLERYIR